MRTCLTCRLHLARRLNCRLDRVGTQAANATVYGGYKVPLPVAREEPVGWVQGEVGVIAAVSF